METFTFFWRDGKVEVLQGDHVSDALSRAGYGLGAISALDFFSAGDTRDEYVWDVEEHEWQSLEILKMTRANNI